MLVTFWNLFALTGDVFHFVQDDGTVEQGTDPMSYNNAVHCKSSCLLLFLVFSHATRG